MSPEVWADALPRIQATATGLGILVALPNEDFTGRPNPPAPWLDIEAAAESAQTLEMGGRIWEEEGSLFLHLMIPVGTGITAGLTMRKAFSVAFRAVSDAINGLYYRGGQAFDPLGPGSDDGVYRRLSLIVRYSFQDITT
jgi:hypothetical protein